MTRRAQKKVHLDQLEKRKVEKHDEIYVGIEKSATNVIDHLVLALLALFLEARRKNIESSANTIWDI